MDKSTDEIIGVDIKPIVKEFEKDSDNATIGAMAYAIGKLREQMQPMVYIESIDCDRDAIFYEVPYEFFCNNQSGFNRLFAKKSWPYKLTSKPEPYMELFDGTELTCEF